MVHQPGSSQPLSAGATWLLAALHALIFALLWPPFDLWPLAFVAAAPLAWLGTRARSMQAAALAVAVTQFLMWLWINRWLINVTVVGYPALGAYMLIYPILFAWIIRRVSRHPHLHRWPMTLIVPIVWTGVEFLRGTLAFDGYPWFLLGQPLIEWLPFAQSADLFGTYFISFLAALPAGFIVDYLRLASAAKTADRLLPETRSSRAILRAMVVRLTIVIVALAGNVAYGMWRMNQNTPLRPGPTVLAIQTNLPQSNKIAWTPEQQARDFHNFALQTLDAFKQATESAQQIDMVIWPETMLPGYGLEPQAVEYLSTHDYVPGDHFVREVLTLRELLGTPLLVGSPAYIGLEVRDGRWHADANYNSAYLIDGQPPFQRYDKIVLTPFGETMPYISAWPWLERQLIRVGVGADLSFDLDAGESIVRLKLPREDGDDPFVFATPICFEDTVAWYCRRLVYDDGSKVADALINLSNDGWFSFSRADRKLHAKIARFRAIENRVPVVRCVNTGLSVSIDSAGRVVEAVGQGRYGVAEQAGSMIDQIVLDSRQTIYGRIGELWPWTCIVITAILAVWTYLRRAPQRTA